MLCDFLEKSFLWVLSVLSLPYISCLSYIVGNAIFGVYICKFKFYISMTSLKQFKRGFYEYTYARSTNCYEVLFFSLRKIFITLVELLQFKCSYN